MERLDPWVIGRFVETLGLPLVLGVVIGIALSRIRVTPENTLERLQVESMEELISQVVGQIDALVFRNHHVHFSLAMLEEMLNVDFGAIEDLSHLELVKTVYQSIDIHGILSPFYDQALLAAGIL